MSFDSRQLINSGSKANLPSLTLNQNDIEGNGMVEKKTWDLLQLKVLKGS